MSVRPPTLREKRRYILARIDSASVCPDPKDLYYAIYEAVVSLFGDFSAAAMQPSVLAIENGYAILRCRRGSEREFSLALSTLFQCRDSTIALRILATSGTIESLRERVSSLETSYGENLKKSEDDQSNSGSVQYLFDSRDVEIVSWSGHKVDVLEKGFKNTRRLFVTKEELEIIHATTISDGL